MDRDTLLHLLDAYLENALDDVGRAALERELVSCPAARALFWEYVQQHALLGELHAEAQGLRLARQEQTPCVPRRRWASVLSGLAAALLLALTGALFLLGPPGEGRVKAAAPVARLGEVRGDVYVRVKGAEARAEPGQALLSGQEVRTGGTGFAVVHYADSTRLELNADTAVRLLEQLSAAVGKRVFLVRGELSGSVEGTAAAGPLLLSTRHAEVRVEARRFSSASVLGETRLEVEDGRALFTGKNDERGVEVRPGSYAVATDDEEPFADRLPAPAGEPRAVLHEGSGPVLALAVAPNGRAVWTGGWDGSLKRWDPATGRLAADLGTGERKRVNVLVCSRDGRTLAVGGEAAKGKHTLGVTVWDPAGERERATLPDYRQASALAFAGDGGTLVLVGNGKGVRGLSVWDVRPGREPALLHNRPGPEPASLAVSPDGATLAVGERNGTFRLEDLATGRALRVFKAHKKDVKALAFSPDGATLASGGRDGTVVLWDVGTGDRRRALGSKFGEVRCLAFSPDGRRLATSHGGVAKLWDLADGRELTTLKAHKFAVTCLAFLPDGRTLATAGWDRTAKLWDLPLATPRPE